MSPSRQRNQYNRARFEPSYGRLPAVAEQRATRLHHNFSNHAAERYGSTRGARSPGVNPWLVARSAFSTGAR